MREVPATEAKARLAELLRAVEQGERVAITRHGRAVAHLLPAIGDDAALREAVARFRARRGAWAPARFGAEAIRAARHEGHRA